MKPKHRLIIAALVGVFTAAAVGRADFGADVEAMVLRAPAFWAALPTGLAAGYLGARAFGLFTPAGFLRSGVVMLVALVLALLTAGALVTDLARLIRWMAQPMAWGAVMAGWVPRSLLRGARGSDRVSRGSSGCP